MRTYEATQYDQPERAAAAAAPTVERDTAGHLDIPELRRVARQAYDRSQNLDHFRKTWGGAVSLKEGRQIKPIELAPKYGKSHIMDFSLLAMIILVEGLANAYFFSKASDLGLLGGWMQAITVSGTNVITAFFLIGYLGLRMTTNPHRPGRMGAGWAMVAVSTLAIFALNLSAAQYRDLLEVHANTLALGPSAENAEDMMLAQTMNWNPFDLRTLEARLLFLLGMTFAAIAAYKGFSFSDPIMGYTETANRANEKLQELNRLTKLPRDKRKSLSDQDLEQLVWAESIRDDLTAVLDGPMYPTPKASKKSDNDDE